MDNSNIMLSIVVPVYNVEKYIGQCIKSILMQDIKNCEIIIVNDETPDKSIEIVRKFNDSRIKIINKKNGGISSARNLGIDEAKGKYIAFIDSDDFLNFNNAYSEMIEKAERFNADVVVGNANWYYNEKHIEIIDKEAKVYKNNWLSGEEYLIKAIETKKMYIPVWLNIYRRKLIVDNNLRFKNGILHEDELFSNELFLKAKRVALYNKPFYNYRQREGSIMSSKDNTQKRTKDMFTVCLELMKDSKSIESVKLKEAMVNYTVYLAINICYVHRKKVPNEIKKLISNNGNKKIFKIEAFFLNVNENLFYLFEFLIRKLSSIKRKILKIKV